MAVCVRMCLWEKHPVQLWVPLLVFCKANVSAVTFYHLQAGISAAPARAVSAVKEMNIPQKIKDIKLPDLPSIGNLKF